MTPRILNSSGGTTMTSYDVIGIELEKHRFELAGIDDAQQDFSQEIDRP